MDRDDGIGTLLKIDRSAELLHEVDDPPKAERARVFNGEILWKRSTSAREREGGT